MEAFCRDREQTINRPQSEYDLGQFIILQLAKKPVNVLVRRLASNLHEQNLQIDRTYHRRLLWGCKT
jgi:hypothetical protein